MVDPEPDSTAAPWFGDAIRGQRLDWLVLCGVFLMGAYCASLASNGPIDDALILHQYVDRVLEGKGLTFNDGEYGRPSACTLP